MLKSVISKMQFSLVVSLTSLVSFLIPVILFVLFDIANKGTDAVGTISFLLLLCSTPWAVYDLYVQYSNKKMEKDLAKVE